MSNFRDMKFRVKKEEHSRKIQEYLFSLGYKWRDGSKQVQLTSEPYLYADRKGKILKGETWVHFKGDTCPEYTLEETVAYSLKEVDTKNKEIEEIEKEMRALADRLEEIKNG